MCFSSALSMPRRETPSQNWSTNNGSFGACWCISFHLTGVERGSHIVRRRRPRSGKGPPTPRWRSIGTERRRDGAGTACPGTLQTSSTGVNMTSTRRPFPPGRQAGRAPRTGPTLSPPTEPGGRLGTAHWPVRGRPVGSRGRRVLTPCAAPASPRGRSPAAGQETERRFPPARRESCRGPRRPATPPAGRDYGPR